MSEEENTSEQYLKQKLNFYKKIGKLNRNPHSYQRLSLQELYDLREQIFRFKVQHLQFIPLHFIDLCIERSPESQKSQRYLKMKKKLKNQKEKEKKKQLYGNYFTKIIDKIGFTNILWKYICPNLSFSQIKNQKKSSALLNGNHPQEEQEQVFLQNDFKNKLS